jgi:hypothetical protein
MSHLTLIPFGLRTADRRLVDVSEVPQGAGCRCICPSCRAPLIARQGEVKQWHFAHASRGVENEDIRQCEYSFFLSVALMAKQQFLECNGLVLPDYIHHLSVQGRWSRRVYRDSIALTRGRRVIPGQCWVDRQLEGHAVDVLCEIEGVPLGIVLERPDRKPHLCAADFTGKKVGVVKIDLLETLRIFRKMDPKRKAEGFHQALGRFLFERRDNKAWIYHPRQEIRIQAKLDELNARLEREEAPFREQRERQRRKRQAAGIRNAPRRADPRSVEFEKTPSPTPEPPSECTPMDKQRQELLERPPRNPRPSAPKPKPDLGGPTGYECVLCDYTWTGTRLGLNPCPKCGSHLYRRELKGEA